MEKQRTKEEDIEFLTWLKDHSYKEAPASKWKMANGEPLTEGAARAWKFRLKQRYQDARWYVNEVTTLMRMSQRIKRMMLSMGVEKEVED